MGLRAAIYQPFLGKTLSWFTMQKFVTTRGCNFTMQRRDSSHEIQEDLFLASERQKQEEVQETDSGIEAYDANDESAFLLERLFINSMSDTGIPSKPLQCDSNNQFARFAINKQLAEALPNAKEDNHHNSSPQIRSYKYSDVHHSESKSWCISNPNVNSDFNCLQNRKFIKKREAMFYYLQNKRHNSKELCWSLIPCSDDQNELLHPVPALRSLTCDTSLTNILDLQEQIPNVNKVATLPRKCKLCVKNAPSRSLKRTWFSSESLHRRSKLPEIMEELFKDSLTSAAVSSIQSKYLGAENLSETMQDIFLLTKILKRFASCDPPDKTLTMAEFKAKRIICKRAIRNFTINMKNAILNYESQTFVDSCRLSCCLSYADVVSCTCLLLDYLSVPTDRNILATKVSSVGSTFCRVVILANSSLGKHSREKSSKVFFQSTDRLIESLNGLTVHVGNLRQHSVSRKF